MTKSSPKDPAAVTAADIAAATGTAAGAAGYRCALKCRVSRSAALSIRFGSS